MIKSDRRLTYVQYDLTLWPFKLTRMTKSTLQKTKIQKNSKKQLNGDIFNKVLTSNSQNLWPDLIDVLYVISNAILQFRHLNEL